MKLSIKHIILVVFFILSCEGPIFEIPPEPDTTAPLIEITNPADQGVLSDTVLVTMYASDNDEVNIVQLYINDSLVLDSAKSPYEYKWNTNDYEEDEYHNLLARAVDFAGNDNQTSPIRVMVDNNDNIKPSGSFLYPFSGQILSGIVSIIADASDNDSLASVIFYINGDSVGVSTSAPHIYEWNTNLEFDDYSYVISLKVNDASGNYITLGPISVTVDNEENIQYDTTPPTGTIVYPPMAAIVSGIITIQVDAFDNEKVEKVDLIIDGTNPQSDYTSPYEFTWNTTVDEVEEDANHFIAATVTDTSGNTTNLMPVTVFVDNEENIITDITPPSAVITSPASNQIVSGNVIINVAAFDNISIEKIEFYLNGILYLTDSNFPYEASWNTINEGTSEGEHIWFVKAYDTSGLINQSESIMVIVDNIDELSPSGYIAQPYAGQVVNGQVEILIYATDNVGVSSVNVFINGENDSTFINETSIANAPYSYIWNTLDTDITEDEQYFISARINDEAGNFFNVPSVAVVVNNNTEFVDLVPPVISILSPISGTTVRDSTQIRVFANDNVGISSVVVTIDDSLNFTLTDSPYVAAWNTYEYPNNSNHIISAKAIDSSENETNAQSIYVIVDNYYNESISFLNTERYVDSIGLSWDIPYEAEQFLVIRDGDTIASTINNNYIDRNITSGVFYCYQISAVNSYAISGPLSSTECEKALISPPSNFTGAISQDTIRLTWSNVLEANQYRLYRDGNLIYTGDALNYTDANLSFATTYNYTISCMDDIGEEGPQSSPLELLTEVELLAPSFLNTTRYIESIGLSWDSPIGAEQFLIIRDDVIIGSTFETSYIDQTTSPNTTYCYKIAALNSNGISSPLSESACDKPYIGTPDNFTGLISQNTIQLSWSNVEGASEYNLFRNGTIIYNGSELTFLDDNLNYGTVYNYTISSFDLSGEEGTQSDPIELITHTQLLAPTLSVEADTTSFILNWSSVASATSYKIYVDDLPNTLEIETTTYTFEGEIGVQNCFKIRAVNEHGTIGPESNQECATGN